jgi:hypothetical protein
MKRIVCAVLLVLVMLAVPVSGSGTTVRVDSATIGVGQEANVSVWIENVTGLYGGDVRLAFDPAVIAVVSMTAGTMPYPDFLVRCRYTVSTTWYAAVQLNPRPPASGTGVMYTVRVRGIAVGTTALHITYSKLATRDGMVIPAAPVDGGVMVVGTPPVVPPRRFAAP